MKDKIEYSNGEKDNSLVTSPNVLQVNGKQTNGNHSDGVTHSNGVTKCPMRPFKLTNLLDGTETIDTLHTKSLNNGNTPCDSKRCEGSIYITETAENRAPGILRSSENTKNQALDFLNQYYQSLESENSDTHKARVESVIHQIENTGTYEMEEEELMFGARLAWRNSARCIGRIQWKKLQVFDYRHVTTPKQMFEAILLHLKYSSNKGKIRSAMTVFPRRKSNLKDYRVWNTQLLQYAGYKRVDGSIIGDPAGVELAELAMFLGWKPKGGSFDILPLILQANGEQPECFEVPQEYIDQVDIKHPNFPALDELNLKWFTIPAVSCIMLDVGGLEFTAAPFNGWYMASEIGARNLTDASRYNLTKPIATLMKLDTSNNTSLWKDKVMVEITYAVLHSFNKAGVTIVDHHTAAESFMKHFKDEVKTRGGCPADWVWIVPPLSGSLTPVFHQEMLNYKMKPSYEYQVQPWKYFKLASKESDQTGGSPQQTKKTMKDVVKGIIFSSKMMMSAMAKRHKVVILYASETGKSETFAQTLNSLFLHAFDSKVMCMSDYDVTRIEYDQCILFVSSTTGNGEAPDNGQDFGNSLNTLLHKSSNETVSTRLNDSFHSDILSNLRYSVFALGSKAYPQFCAYGHYLNQLLNKLGGEEMYPIAEGDELSGQEESFNSWALSCFEAACEVFCVPGVNMSEVSKIISNVSSQETAGNYRLTKVTKEQTLQENLCKELSTLHKRKIYANELVSVENLQNESSGRVTNLVRIKINFKEEMEFKAGDHLCVYPSNDSTMVKELLQRVNCDVDINDLINVEVKNTESEQWDIIKRLPMPTSLEHMFTNYFDITSPPTMKMLMQLAMYCTSEDECKQLTKLTENDETYGNWKYQNYANLLEVLQTFPSIQVDATFLVNELPILKPRYYSISSSLAEHPDEIHLTVALVRYTLTNGNNHNGVCSSWFNSLAKHTIIPCCIKRAPLFHMPSNNNEPIIMIGPGTGIAPYRSFWQERMNVNNPSVGEMILFFGCRDSQLDDIYAKEFPNIIEKRGLTQIFTAYSRDKKHPKKYVQQLLLEQSNLICNLILQEKAHIYVCGDVTMATDVFKTLTLMMEEYMAISHDMAQELFKELRSNGKYHEDIFGVTLKVQEVTSKIRTATKRIKDRGSLTKQRSMSSHFIPNIR